MSELITEVKLMVRCCNKNNIRKKPDKAIAIFRATDKPRTPDCVAINIRCSLGQMYGPNVQGKARINLINADHQTTLIFLNQRFNL